MDIQCEQCNQTLRVTGAAVGAAVKCPKCAATTIIKEPADAAVLVKPVSEKIAVKCPGCKRTLSVAKPAAPVTLACPSCSAKFRLGGAQNTPPPSAPVQQARPAPAPAPAATPATNDMNFFGQGGAAANAGQPFGNVPAQASTGYPGQPAQAAAGYPGQPAQAATGYPGQPARASSFSSPQSAPRSSSAGFGGWVKTHILASVIIVMCSLTLLLSLFNDWSIVVVAVVHAVIGLVIAALTLIPRKHVIAKVMETFGAAASGMSAGGVALLCLVVIAKFVRVQRRVGGMDFDMNQMSTLVGTLAGMFAFFLTVVCLWHFFGIFRVMGGMYSAYLGLIIIPFMGFGIFVTNQRSNRAAEAEERMQRFQEESEARHQEMIDRMEAGPTFNPQPRPALSGQITITIDHSKDFRMQPHRESLVKQAGNSSWSVRRTGATRTVMLIRFQGTIDQLAAMIDFGKVTNVDKDARTIAVTVP